MKKQAIIFENGTYKIPKFNHPGLSEFADFLASDVGFAFGENYLRWAQNTKERKTGGNRYELEKKNNTIVMTDGIIEIPDDKNNPIFSISISNFISVLKKWQQFLKRKFKKITVIQAENTITIEPSDFLTSEDTSPPLITRSQKKEINKIKKAVVKKLEKVIEDLPEEKLFDN